MEQQALELIASLGRRGILVIARPERGVISVMRSSKVTDEDRQAIRANKPALMDLLSDPAERVRRLAEFCDRTGQDLSELLDRYAPGVLAEITPFSVLQ
jgi:molybdopterin biosynthesis enzyme